MNKARRAEIMRVHKLIASIKDDLESHNETVETAKDEESEYYDNMPESIQASDKGEAANAASDALEEAHSKIQEAIDALEEALDYLETSAD